MASDNADSGHPIDLSHVGRDTIVTAQTLAAEVRRIREDAPPIPSQLVGVGRTRKIALIGSASTIDFAPWFDASWEIWAHATCHNLTRRADRYFDVHPWKWIQEKNQPLYLQWLKDNRVPIYMAEQHKSVPASFRFPLERLQSEFPYPFGSHAAYMVALALSEGVSHIGFFGIHYDVGPEYQEQRPNAEFWAGIAVGRGVQLVIPQVSPFCHEPRDLYGYESHSGPNAQDRWKRRLEHQMDTQTGRVLVTQVTAEESAQQARAGLPKNVENMRRQAAGQPPLLPSGEPAW